ncbi:putative kinesin [Leptomonas seymouri]|uniref:Putative kinesin n=1 Tax=Leptomonas seymouri TaxID=5684 RepID=A0A0N0P328_LEPSE|nr:putative kinesin [Leptomonas seymouri]|eukprot:KPI83177.1 putative kinesin [Leptomonas seymouri]
MRPVSMQDSTEVDNSSVTSSSAKTVYSPSSQRKGFLGNETSATKVFVRVRPFSAGELKQSDSGEPPAIVTVSDENPCHITTLDPSKQYTPKSTYVFDRCFNSAVIKPAAGDDAQLLLPDGKDGSAVVLSTLQDVAAEALLNPLQLDCLSRDQATVYGCVGRPVLMNALAGYNGCVFAYGQTGSGKTYTMMGPPGTFGAIATTATGVSNSSMIQAGGGASVSSPRGKKFRRAATGYAGLQRTQQDTTITNSSIDDAGDSRFQSYASMTPLVGTTTHCTPRLAHTASPLDNELTSCCDSTLKTGCGGHSKGTVGLHGDEGLQGIVPRLVRDLFDELHLKRERDSSHSFRVEVEYYEIYREKVMDLLSSHSANTNAELRVRQSKTSGPYVENLQRKHVEDERQVFRLLQQGNLRRHTASTAMNDRSSRSHAIFVLHLVQMHIAEQDSSSAKVTSKVNLVDLAGSEKTGAHNTEGDQFKEGVVINNSLTVLGRVIDALADKSQGKRNVFCPYRDSVLTWLLMDSLGGNSKTTMLATVSPYCMFFEETCQTLRYASRAQQIVTKVVVNEDPQVRQIKMLTAEVLRLKALLVADGKVADNDEDIEALQDRIHALEEELNDTRSELEEKMAELSSLQALRRVTSSLPSSLKPGRTGAAAAAKELSKAKSDVRRLEAENLLHLQTEEELRRSLERIKTLELRHKQLQADLKEAQESAKQMERERHDQDKRIAELEQQLFLGQGKTEESPRTASSPLMSPSGVPANPSSLERRAAGTAVHGKKASKKSKGGPTVADAALTTAASTDAVWEAAKAELCAQFDEEKKLLNLQVQERTEAFRRSQLDVKKLKTELSSAQDSLQALEKQLNGHQVDATRCQKEMQELRRTLKQERKSNKDIRQSMSGPVEERLVFSFAHVSRALMVQERAVRDSVVAEEVAARKLVKQVIQLSKAERETVTRMTEAHAAQLADLHSKVHEGAQELADLRASHDELQAAHSALMQVNEEHVAAMARLKPQLSDLLAAKEEATRARREETARLEDQINAFRKQTAEQQESAAAQDRQVQDLRAEVSALHAQLQQEKMRLSAAAADHACQLADKESALTSAATALIAVEEAQAQQLAKLNAQHAAQVSTLEAKTNELQKQLQSAKEDLHHEREARKVEAQRNVEQAKQRQEALADLQLRLDTTVQSHARAAEIFEVEQLALKEQLAKQETVATANAATLQRQVDELQQALGARAADNNRTVCDLTTQLTAAHADLSKSEEARQTLEERLMKQAAAYEEQLLSLREEIASEKAAKSWVENEHAVAMQSAAAELLRQRRQSEEACGSLTHRVEALQAQLTSLEETRQSEKGRSAEVSATHIAMLEALRDDIEKEKAAQAALASAHVEEIQKLREASARKEQAFQSQAELLEKQLTSIRAEMQASNAHHVESIAKLEQKLDTSHAELQRSEAARRHQIQRSLEQAAEHARAMEEVRSQLGSAKADATAADAAYEQRARELEDRLAVQQAEATKVAAGLQLQLQQKEASLLQEQASSSQTITSLEEKLSDVRQEMQRLEEAHRTSVQRSVEQAAAHERGEGELAAKLAAAAEEALACQAAHTKEVAELQQELLAKESYLVAQMNALNEHLQAQEALAQTRLDDREGQLMAVKKELEMAQEGFSKSEQERKALVTQSLAQANEYNESLAALQCQLEKEKEEATVAVATLTKQLVDTERRLAQKTATADATATALSEELAIQRESAAAQAAQHARSTKELEDRLAAAQKEVQRVSNARKSDQEDFARASAAHATVTTALKAELAESVRARAVLDAEHKTAIQRIKTDIATTAESNKTAAERLQKDLCEAEAQLAHSQKALEEQALEGVKQAEAHAESLRSLREMLESNHAQHVAALKKSHASDLASLEAQLAAQTTSVQSLREDLKDTRSQIKQMAETQNYLRVQLENEKLATVELRLCVDTTEKARVASAAEAAKLQKQLKAATTSLERLKEEGAKLSSELQQAREVSCTVQQQLDEERRVASEQEQLIVQQAAELKAAQATTESLRSEVNELNNQKAELLKTQEALTERQREQLVTQQVDTVTELEAQFRAMEEERRVIEDKGRQVEESLRAIIEKQSKELQQVREDLDFNISMNQLESAEVRQGTTNGGDTVSSSAGIAGNGVNAASSPIGGGAGVNKSLPNGSFTGRHASPAARNFVGGSVAGMFSSFFRRSTTGTILGTAGSNASSPHGISQTAQRRSSVLHTRGGDREPRPTATTPVRHGSNFYNPNSFRRSSAAPLFSIVSASGSSASVGAGRRKVSEDSVDAYVSDPDFNSWQNPSVDLPQNSH